MRKPKVAVPLKPLRYLDVPVDIPLAGANRDVEPGVTWSADPVERAAQERRSRERLAATVAERAESARLRGPSITD